ncbi:hypothetical protein SEPCBS119000_006516 [Sporothrix epigloea]|uniref:Gag protein n=1 Tax=Sporothrix epigloea TaxID=1892477 RepID=A0ABP0E3F4_9PEZI
MDTRLQERLRQQSEQALSGSGTSDVYTNEHQLEESITPQSTRVQSLRRSIAESRLNRFQDNAATARVTMCDSSDWTKWRSQLSINLRIIGIRKVDELTTYDELANIAVRFFIDSTISEDICLATEHIEDTVELFNYLENTYGPEQRSNISEYARAYHALKWKQGEQVQALLSRTESVWSSYSTHVTPLTHNAKLAQLLAIVEEKNQFVYANLVNSLNTTWSGLSEEKILAELKTLLVNLTRDRRRPQAVRTHSDDSFETPTPTPLEYTASSTVTPVDNTAPTAAKHV